MLRKLAIVVLILAVIGAAVFWLVTIPATVPASALPAYAPNLENGKTMFYAGGCSSCHAIPNQGQDQARRRARIEIAVRHFLCSEHFARS